MVSKGIGFAIALLVITISFTPAFALTELERSSVNNPRLENAFGLQISDNVNVNHQMQISADITNNQDKSQTFVYLVQIKDKTGFVVSLGWISGQLTPDQKLSPSLSWSPKSEGEFTAEIYVWEGFPINHKALAEYTTLKINVS
ncbi:MAG: hypothetical protein K5790_02230 [Nitrosopumilus sp.]|uniref:hypothetical protein n=1 Tax=Nitrosopumilus sp. TaxID=2024843 RepID=UPI00247C0DD2|nr:hypothetical protein [Nitrosopumilus sp.]MCV0392092.1 hypothetical protein [Nitrosopumilus sp.]